MLEGNGPAPGWKRQEVVIDMPDHWTWNDVQRAIISELNREAARSFKERGGQEGE